MEKKIALQQKELHIINTKNSLKHLVRQIVWLDEQIRNNESEIADLGTVGGKRPVRFLVSELEIRYVELFGPLGPVESLKELGVSDEGISNEIGMAFNSRHKNFLNEFNKVSDVKGVIDFDRLKKVFM